jgi:RNA polymerase sigma-70 factor (ECF subfamily)
LFNQGFGSGADITHVTMASGGASLTTVEEGERPNAAPLADRALAELAMSDPSAFAELYRRYVGLVFGLAYRRSGSREVAEEVASATFEHAWRAMPTFRWRGGGFRAWLIRIALTEVAVWYRSNDRSNRPRAQMVLREMAQETLFADFDTSDGLYGSEDVELVRRALTELRPRYQEAIAIRYFAELSHEEAAEAMGCSKAVLAVTLHRALGALRKKVEKLQEAQS